MQEAVLWKKERNGVRCELCERRCFISKDKSGYCLVRKNSENKLYSLNYGKILDISTNTIEKNPLFHFMPGSATLSLTMPGTNFFHTPEEIEKTFKDKDHNETVGKDYTPEQIVKFAEDKGVASITFSAEEPFINFEFAIKVAKLAHRSSIKNTFITNGYASEESVKKIAKFLDAATVNFYGSGDAEFYQKFFDVPNMRPIFDTVKQIKKQRLHLEITNLVVPQIGDSSESCKELADWINAELGSGVPFHVLRFFASPRFSDIPATCVGSLDKCIDEAKKAGLRYVYVGGVPGHSEENTYCYNCRELLITREGGKVKKSKLSNDRCPTCGLKINVVTS
jgi:pyruvate formate lyase activating enzyme